MSALRSAIWRALDTHGGDEEEAYDDVWEQLKRASRDHPPLWDDFADVVLAPLIRPDTPIWEAAKEAYTVAEGDQARAGRALSEVVFNVRENPQRAGEFARFVEEWRAKYAAIVREVAAAWRRHRGDES